MKRVACLVSAAVLCLAIGLFAQERPLTVVSTAPEGELATLDQANEIRVVFSEPMVTLGRVPAQVSAPFFSVTPAVPGSFRWAGTTTLVFTPDPKQPLRYATTYQVTVAPTAVSAGGRKLAKPVTFSFTTPPVRLVETHWYRRGNTVAGRMVILMRFNQPVRAADIAAATTAALEPHDWTPPEFTPDEQARLTAIDPQALARFNDKVRATRAVAAGAGSVALRLTTDWDKKPFPESPDLVALETVNVPAPESWIKLQVGGNVRSPAGPATPREPQSHVIEGEPAFFIDGFRCTAECDGDGWNPIKMRAAVRASAFAAAVIATDITAGEQRVPKKAAPAAPTPSDELDVSQSLTLEDAGYDAQPPNRTYAVSARSDLRSADGQTLGYTWLGIVENWHSRAFSSFGDGTGVWETDGGAQLPFYARNLQTVTQWARRLQPPDIMPVIERLMKAGFNEAPQGAGTVRKLPVTPNAIQSHGLDLSRLLTNGSGVVWTAVREGDPIPRARRVAEGDDPRTRASLVQVTNLGITVKDSPLNTLIFVTRLDNGAPVPGANVSIVRTGNQTFWRGVTGSDGTVLVPDTPLRPQGTWEFAFIVTAEKDGDVAFVGSDWNEGIQGWDFGTWINLDEAAPLLRGQVFTDRGVYRLGEEVQFKAILRSNTPTGIRLLPAGTPVVVVVRDAQNRIVDQRSVKLSPWSSAEWTFTLPADGALGDYSLRAYLESDRPKPQAQGARERARRDDDEEVPYQRVVQSTFLVAAYRRPDFRVDVGLTAANPIAGDEVKGVISARYLFGATVGARPVRWQITKSPVFEAPGAITDKFTDDRWTFVGDPVRDEDSPLALVGQAETTLDKTGDLSLPVPTARDAGIPFEYTLEGNVTDVSRQQIANRRSILVHPAPWYVGLRRPSYFIQQKEGLKTEIITVAPNAQVVAGVPVQVTLTQVQWHSIRRAEGNGFYTWETERRETPAGQWTVKTAADPVPLAIPFSAGGYYILEAKAQAGDGRSAITRTSFYVLGDGYTAWARYDHNRIDLVPERKTYKPGDNARIMIQSPWETATALVTTEREGIRSHRQFALTSTQQSITVPIADADIPNVFVSVLLVKGRTNPAVPVGAAKPGAVVDATADTSDPGKPAFRLGYVELKVEDASKRLTVDVSADREEYRPASKAALKVNVRDVQGRGSASEVTLWAVDYGVLSLTSYNTPDVLSSVYVHKALQVMNADSRQKIISRRVLTPKGATEGGGGGVDGGTMRRDFRVLAFWLGSVVTDANGDATANVTLPESLTTYRIMAVAADRNNRFGSDDTDIRTNKPLTLKPAYPRFLAVGDSAHFGAVVTNQLAQAGTAVVTMRSLDPSVLEIVSGAEQRVNVPAGGALEVRYQATGRSIGRARVQMTVRIGAETDSFEDIIPVEVLVSPETVAAYGEATDANATATAPLTLPAGVVPGFGGLSVDVASTALVGLSDGARYLVDYPYGCAEQKSSRLSALVLAADLGDAFSLGLDTKTMRAASLETIRELERFQCETGGFAFWPGACESVSPYLTSYVLHRLKIAADLKYAVNEDVRSRAYDYLDRELGTDAPANESSWPAYTAWQAFALKVLAEGGRKPDSHLTRIYGYRNRMPVFALAFLHDAMTANGETTGARVTEIRRRLTNAIRTEAGSAHVEELGDPYLLWYWNSNVRSTAIVLNSLVRAKVPGAPVRELVRWLMNAREDGRWGNTQENAYAMEALVNYYRTYETAVPDFRAIVRLGQQELLRGQFQGRTTNSTSVDRPMQKLLAAGSPGTNQTLSFTREGTGTLFYSARLRYAANEMFQQGLDSGFRIERTYEPFVENGTGKPSTTYAAGDLVRVTLTLRLTQERRFVAVTDPLPAGMEAVESWFATTARALAAEQDQQRGSRERSAGEGDWNNWWQVGGFDHVERHDDRVRLFATRLSEGVHEFSYIVRATTAGTFRTAPAHAEQMYEPEVFGRTETAIVTIKQ